MRASFKEAQFLGHCIGKIIWLSYLFWIFFRCYLTPKRKGNMTCMGLWKVRIRGQAEVDMVFTNKIQRMVLKVICSSSMFLFLPFIINVKMLSIYILIKSWAPWSNIHTSECKGPKIKPDSRHFIFLLSDVASRPDRDQHFRKRKLETTPVGLGQPGSCQFTLKLDQIWAETMDNAGNDKFWSASVKN